MLREMGADIRRRQRTRGYYTASVPEGAGLFETIAAISNRDDVFFAEPSEFGIDDALDDSIEGDAGSYRLRPRSGGEDCRPGQAVDSGN